MREVAIVGIGQTSVAEHWNRSLRSLAVEALLDAMEDAHVKNVDALYVGNMLGGELAQQEHLGALIADYAGLEGIEAVKVEAACGSAAAALRQAMLAVSSGVAEVAIAVGVEKLTELTSNCTQNALAMAADADFETQMGLSFVAINALVMQRYMYEYGVDKEEFGVFSVNAHANAVHNPNAMFNFPITMEQYADAKMIATPINLLDSSPIADGAAAVVVTTAERARDLSDKPLRLLACEIGTDTISLHDREELLWLKGVERSTKKALARAGKRHEEIDFFELHDAFSIMAALSLESAGFVERGQAVRFAHHGAIRRVGDLPITTMGGLKGRGHPVGATGLYQIVEAALQLRGQAPDALQVPDARVAMTQNIGGSGATVVTTILERWIG
ncbi:MAG: thiolase domain-containing protein [Chloroflexota bacterium]|nr:thiolase domain-containing protein [Chloroflexota bacterium]